MRELQNQDRYQGFLVANVGCRCSISRYSSTLSAKKFPLISTVHLNMIEKFTDGVHLRCANKVNFNNQLQEIFI